MSDVARQISPKPHSNMCMVGGVPDGGVENGPAVAVEAGVDVGGVVDQELNYLHGLRS